MTDSQTETATFPDEITNLEFGISPYGIPAGELANAIERFRQQEQRSDDYLEGYRVGTEWCLHQASLAELRSLALADTRDDFTVSMRGIARLLTPGKVDEHKSFEFWRDTIGLTRKQLEAFVGYYAAPTGNGSSFSTGFRESAGRVWRIVRDRLWSDPTAPHFAGTDNHVRPIRPDRNGRCHSGLDFLRHCRRGGMVQST